MMREIGAALLSAGLLVTVPPMPAAPPVQAGGDRVEARTESSTTTVRPDGGRLLTLYTGTVQMRAGAEWVPVDLTLAPGPDGVARPLAAPHDLRLTPQGPVVTFAGGGAAALDWTTSLPAPVLAGPRATYPQARPGYDLVVEATRAGFVASLRRGAAAPAGTPTAPVTPLALRTTTEGGPEAHAEAEPAAQERGPMTEAESSVSRVVAAAPATATVPFDTTVQSTVLRSDLGGDPDLRLGSYDGTAVARSYLTFPLAELTGRPIVSAVLRLHQDWSAGCQPRSWEVWSTAQAGPSTRWANQPLGEHRWASTTETRGRNPECAAGWTGVEVTELVRAWARGGAPIGTVQLRATDEADPASWKRMGSAESTNVPHLDVQLG
ncbi:DNRLRE domain-containing protein [Pseudonocardia sp. TRM90224]|uniref:DNRLRE domain-containing protein n=1 Tax=Pseudonocardia sp. TRM90224 TaxID=2812678 RepID=UPI001E62C489|nr:DNRLRE domain-containing protein [Pseudonocardia sp. TRM90224]